MTKKFRIGIAVALFTVAFTSAIAIAVEPDCQACMLSCQRAGNGSCELRCDRQCRQP